MIQVIEAPNNTKCSHTALCIFLAGGIVSCPDWQQDLIDKISSSQYVNDLDDLYGDIILFNPRRKNFPIDDPTATETQITWEFNKLAFADIIIFWFSAGSINPIVLYELGKWGNSSNRNIIIGVHPDYERKEDVIIQTKLARPDLTVVFSLDEIVDLIPSMTAITALR